LGSERFIDRCTRKRFSLGTHLFTQDRFFTYDKYDKRTNDLVTKKDYYNALRKKYASSYYVGDKIPYAFYHFNKLNKAFPNLKVVITLRDIYSVANSYKKRYIDPTDNWSNDIKRSINDWNDLIKALSRKDLQSKAHIVDYNSFFEPATSESVFCELLQNLDLEHDDSINNQYQRTLKYSKVIQSNRNKILTKAEIKTIESHALIEKYTSICKSLIK